MENKTFELLEKVPISTGFAIGNDLVFVPDFVKSLTPEFKSKVYTDSELIYCELFDQSIVRYASTWAAKEAVYKALKQLDPASISWKKIEIKREKIAGRPKVLIHVPNNNYKVSLSISHDGDYVWAVALIKSIQ